MFDCSYPARSRCVLRIAWYTSVFPEIPPATPRVLAVLTRKGRPLRDRANTWVGLRLAAPVLAPREEPAAGHGPHLSQRVRPNRRQRRRDCAVGDRRQDGEQEPRHDHAHRADCSGSSPPTWEMRHARGVPRTHTSVVDPAHTPVHGRRTLGLRLRLEGGPSPALVSSSPRVAPEPFRHQRAIAA